MKAPAPVGKTSISSSPGVTSRYQVIFTTWHERTATGLVTPRVFIFPPLPQFRTSSLTRPLLSSTLYDYHLTRPASDPLSRRGESGGTFWRLEVKRTLKLTPVCKPHSQCNKYCGECPIPRDQSVKCSFDVRITFLEPHELGQQTLGTPWLLHTPRPALLENCGPSPHCLSRSTFLFGFTDFGAFYE